MKLHEFREFCFIREDGTDSPHFKLDDEGLAQMRSLIKEYNEVKKQLTENMKFSSRIPVDQQVRRQVRCCCRAKADKGMCYLQDGAGALVSDRTCVACGAFFNVTDGPGQE